MDRTEKGKRKTARNICFALLGVLLMVILLILLLRGCGSEPQEPMPTPVSSGIVYDPSVVSGGWEEKTESEIVSSLNEKVEEGMINISMNTSPVFSAGDAEGNLMIVNEKVNRYPQVVEITRNDTGDLIYKSGAIPVGSKIESGKLNTALPAGEYECTAHFCNVDPDTGEYLGCAGAVIHLKVLS